MICLFSRTHCKVESLTTHYAMHHSIHAVLSLALGCLFISCASTREQRVTLDQLSAPARVTVENSTAGGKVDKIDREIERGKVVYDVEATVAGKHLEFLIADSNGEILGTETSIEYDALPDAVRVAAEKYFRSSTGLKAMKGIEYGETHYEVEGLKNGRTVEITFDPAGRHTN